MRHGIEKEPEPESEEMLLVLDDPHWRGALRRLAIERRTQETICRVAIGCVRNAFEKED